MQDKSRKSDSPFSISLQGNDDVFFSDPTIPFYPAITNEEHNTDQSKESDFEPPWAPLNRYEEYEIYRCFEKEEEYDEEYDDEMEVEYDEETESDSEIDPEYAALVDDIYY